MIVWAHIVRQDGGEPEAYCATLDVELDRKPFDAWDELFIHLRARGCKPIVVTSPSGHVSRYLPIKEDTVSK